MVAALHFSTVDRVYATAHCLPSFGLVYLLLFLVLFLLLFRLRLVYYWLDFGHTPRSEKARKFWSLYINSAHTIPVYIFHSNF
jgi:hypothetical protein